MKKNKKGFTLIEIIVVLVILAILAAATIPSMLGFVKEANNKAIIAEARTAYVAAQMIATEKYATNAQNQKVSSAEVNKYLDQEAGVTKETTVVSTNGKVDQIEFKYTKKGKTTTILITAGGSTTVSGG
ncbi:MAG: prepilin-type N-terminal cleavage/methylation domain-containing protein [Oscillospiraceae bacterium]